MAAKELDPADNDPVVAGHVDVAEVPSAAWGWSQESQKAQKIAGLVVVVCLLAMIYGNHASGTETLYLVGFSVAIVFFIVRNSINSRRNL